MREMEKVQACSYPARFRELVGTEGGECRVFSECEELEGVLPREEFKTRMKAQAVSPPSTSTSH